MPLGKVKSAPMVEFIKPQKILNFGVYLLRNCPTNVGLIGVYQAYKVLSLYFISSKYTD